MKLKNHGPLSTVVRRAISRNEFPDEVGGPLDKISKFLRDTAPVPVSPRRASARGYPPSRKFTALVYPRINKYNGAFRDFLLVTSPVCDTFPSTVLARLTRPAGAVFLQVSIQVSKSSPSLCLSPIRVTGRGGSTAKRILAISSPIAIIILVHGKLSRRTFVSTPLGNTWPRANIWPYTRKKENHFE